MSLDKFMHYFNRSGYPFIALFCAVTVVLLFVSHTLFLFAFILTVWCFYFFRDPERTTPTRPGLIVSPADGRIVAIQKVNPDDDLMIGDEERYRISVFLNVFDVHVNRMPANGTVRTRRYRPGKFVNAAFDKASVDNERMAIALELEGEHPYNGKILGVVQIAGLVARRIVCYAKQGDRFETGARYGIIRFGSRADIYLPPGLEPQVITGQYMIGGETVLGGLPCQTSLNVSARSGCEP